MGEAFICRRNVLSISPKKYLYNLGDECVAITGGWDKKFNRFSNAQGVLTKNVSSMTIESAPISGYTNTTGSGSNNQISFIGHTRLCFEYDITMILDLDPDVVGLSLSIGAVSSYPPSDTGSYNIFSNTLARNITRITAVGTIQQSRIITKIDIPSINSGYVAFDAWYANTSAFKGRTFQTVHRIWLE